jgi:hypothetical protein
VTGAVIDDSGTYQVKVQYTDASGEAQERFFLESELQV